MEQKTRNNMKAFEVTLEGEKIKVPASIYQHIKPMAKVLYGITTLDVNPKVRKRQARWALGRAVKLVEKIQREIQEYDL